MISLSFLKVFKYNILKEVKDYQRALEKELEDVKKELEEKNCRSDN